MTDFGTVYRICKNYLNYYGKNNSNIMLENIHPFSMYYHSYGVTYTYKTTVFVICLYFYLANETTRYFSVYDSIED